jgi:hypothetical protein
MEQRLAAALSRGKGMAYLVVHDGASGSFADVWRKFGMTRLAVAVGGD